MESCPDGVIVIDKPAGISSAKALGRVKKIMGAAKAGHAGTLDPIATGVLVCCLNRATRLAQFLLSGPKTYAAVLELGVATDTQDFTGRRTAVRSIGSLTAQRVHSVLKEFEGCRMQHPPVFSALKHRGRPLYAYAREGRPIQKPQRPITIDRLHLKKLQLPEIGFEVVCSSGTYVRTLCADIGDRLGCGGHLKSLRRLASSGFHVQNAVPLDTLADWAAAGKAATRVIPMAETLSNLPERTADDPLSRKIRNGRPLFRTELEIAACEPAGEAAPWIKIVDKDRRLLAVVRTVPNRETLAYCCVLNSF